MKRIITITCLAAMAVLIPSCKSWHQVLHEKWSLEGLNRGPRILKNYDTIFIGWLDLTIFESDWKRYGYRSEKEWINFVNNVNIHFIPTQLGARLPGKRILKAHAAGEQPPADAQIYVRFDKSIYYPWNLSSLLFDLDKRFRDREVLHVEMCFIDLRSGKELHRINVALDNSDNNIYYYSYEGHILNRVDSIATFLQRYL